MSTRRLALLAVAACALVGTVAGAAYAAYRATTSNPASTITGAPDWTAPTASASVIARSSGCTPTTPGYVKQAGSYYVYAAVTDTGNPASGISTVTANASALTAAQTAASLSSGSFSVGGVSYTHRTGAKTTDAGVSAGAKTYSLTSMDVAANSGTQNGWPVTVDNTAPTATSINANNKTGGTAGRAENGDTLVLVASEQIEPCSLLASWAGTPTAATLRLQNVGAADTAQIWDSANTTQLPFGTLALNGDVVNGTTVFQATMVESNGTITVTLGNFVSGNLRTDNVTTASVWTPSTTPYDRAQNAMSATPGSGTSHVHF
jgi:hypothetical protein